MKTQEIPTNWNDQKANLKIKFSHLTEKDFLINEGTHGDMMSKLQIKLGKSKEELYRITGGL